MSSYFCCTDSLSSTNEKKGYIMGDLKDVILHVYQLTDLSTTPGSGGRSNGNRASTNNWFTSTFLPSIGLGAYHTSLQVYGYRYTFTGNYGIVKCFSHVEATGLPPNAVFQESIALGRTTYYRDEIAEIINKLSKELYTAHTYHMVHRNCNHFTETFATALVYGERLAEPTIGRLEVYPAWINRLANAGQVIVSMEDDDNETWKPIIEARKAVGIDWIVPNPRKQLTNGTTPATSSSCNQEANNTATKKELTDAQRAALAKVRQK